MAAWLVGTLRAPHVPEPAVFGVGKTRFLCFLNHGQVAGWLIAGSLRCIHCI